MRSSTIGISLLCITLMPCPFVLGQADKPTPREDTKSMLAHQQLLAKTNQGKIDLYFVGDSITRRWGATDYPKFLMHWQKSFFGWNAGNFGWGADGTEHILWRMQNGELDNVHPKVIVLLAGTNNIGKKPANEQKVHEIVRGIQAIVAVLQEKQPDAIIILNGIFPRNDNIAVMPTINQVNEGIAKLADGKKIRYLNINHLLADPDGKLMDGVMVDGLHPSLKGYEIWASNLKPMIQEILGPPLDEDFAPPPTGDPGAKASPN